MLGVPRSWKGAHSILAATQIKALHRPCSKEGKLASKLLNLVSTYSQAKDNGTASTFTGLCQEGTASQRLTLYAHSIPGLTWELLLLGAGHRTFQSERLLFPQDCEFPACLPCQLCGKAGDCGTWSGAEDCWRKSQAGDPCVGFWGCLGSFCVTLDSSAGYQLSTLELKDRL